MKYQANPVIVDAWKITEVMPNDDGTMNVRLKGVFILPTLSADMLARYTPVAGDYYVVQSDGYAYINPKEVFERKYSRL